MRQTKIICTIGPACNNKETILKMIDAGMNVARFNMSHGDYGELEKTFATVKEAIAESGVSEPTFFRQCKKLGIKKIR